MPDIRNSNKEDWKKEEFIKYCRENQFKVGDVVVFNCPKNKLWHNRNCVITKVNLKTELPLYDVTDVKDKTWYGMTSDLTMIYLKEQ